MISFSGTVTIKILGGISSWSPVLFSKILSTIRNATNESARALKYPKRAKEADVDQNKTNQWLRSTGLKKISKKRILRTLLCLSK